MPHTRRKFRLLRKSWNKRTAPKPALRLPISTRKHLAVDRHLSENIRGELAEECRVRRLRVYISNLHRVSGHTPTDMENLYRLLADRLSHTMEAQINMPRPSSCCIVSIENCAAIIHIQRGCRVGVTQLKLIQEITVKVNFLHASAHRHCLTLAARHCNRLLQSRSISKRRSRHHENVPTSASSSVNVITPICIAVRGESDFLLICHRRSIARESNASVNSPTKVSAYSLGTSRCHRCWAVHVSTQSIRSRQNVWSDGHRSLK